MRGKHFASNESILTFQLNYVPRGLTNIRFHQRWDHWMQNAARGLRLQYKSLKKVLQKKTSKNTSKKIILSYKTYMIVFFFQNGRQVFIFKNFFFTILKLFRIFFFVFVKFSYLNFQLKNIIYFIQQNIKYTVEYIFIVFMVGQAL